MVELIELITSLEPRLILYLTNQSAVFSEAMLLGCLRLAPFQIATTMSPVTTGLREIDFYLTGTENEQATPAGSYSEILIPIDGSINSYDGAFLPTRNSNLIDKRSTSITRYCVITGAVAKINKPFLLAVGAALCHHRDLEIWFGCYNPNWSSTIDREGFEKWVSNTLEAIGLDQTRVKFIGPFRDRSQVIEVIRRAELYLDTFPYTGAVSMVDVAAANVTPVIMSGDFPRFDQSRHSLAEMSTEFLLSKSRHEYVNNIVSFLSQKPSAGSIEKRPVGMPKDRPILSDRVWAGIGSFFS
jgi:hypothetical protein